MHDSDAAGEVQRARRLAAYLLLVAITWAVFLICNLVVSGPKFAQGELRPYRHLLHMGPQVVQLFTPCHLPILGEYPDRLYIISGFIFAILQLLIALLIAKSALELRHLKNYRGCWRAVVLTALPFMGPWLGFPCWVLCSFLASFLLKPQVKRAFADSATEKSK